MLGTIVGLLVIGLVAGFIARALVPGKQHMGIGATLLLGLVGSFIGGFLGKLLFGSDSGSGFVQPSGWIGSIIGAIIALLIWISVRRRSHA
ncbi:GlsB/YeaQ/YmgE family stress response membrane protein [Kineococcus sp. SYSU DK002]|uniref:GlsB/YeaQ/YmgE family stress response membrane protein n=1 Tax=Kineococcus sp. SYSU DK002 TaxID=3383123 RepID=UPI003D7D4620